MAGGDALPAEAIGRELRRERTGRSARAVACGDWFGGAALQHLPSDGAHLYSRPMDAPLYNAEILRLAAAISHAGRLDDPHATARRTSPVCGSRVTVDVKVDRDGRITHYGQDVRACALGQASAAILGSGIIDETAVSLARAHGLLAAWLKGEGSLPAELAARFPRLALFEPARAHPARHASICLSFEAAAAAAAEAAQLTPTGQSMIRSG